MTRQELFNIVVEYATTMNHKIVNNDNLPLYHSKKLGKSLIGYLIKNEFYNTSFEGVKLDGTCNVTRDIMYAIERSGYPAIRYLELLHELNEAHHNTKEVSGALFISSLYANLEKVAEQNELIFENSHKIKFDNNLINIMKPYQINGD